VDFSSDVQIQKLAAKFNILYSLIPKMILIIKKCMAEAIDNKSNSFGSIQLHQDLTVLSTFLDALIE